MQTANFYTLNQPYKQRCERIVDTKCFLTLNSNQSINVPDFLLHSINVLEFLCNSLERLNLEGVTNVNQLHWSTENCYWMNIVAVIFLRLTEICFPIHGLLKNRQ